MPYCQKIHYNFGNLYLYVFWRWTLVIWITFFYENPILPITKKDKAYLFDIWTCLLLTFEHARFKQWGKQKNYCFSLIFLHSHRNGLFIISSIIIIVYLFISFRKKCVLNNKKENRIVCFFDSSLIHKSFIYNLWFLLS